MSKGTIGFGKLASKFKKLFQRWVRNDTLKNCHPWWASKFEAFNKRNFNLSKDLVFCRSCNAVWFFKLRLLDHLEGFPFFVLDLNEVTFC